MINVVIEVFEELSMTVFLIRFLANSHKLIA
jgi:hypothetical protein